VLMRLKMAPIPRQTELLGIFEVYTSRNEVVLDSVKVDRFWYTFLGITLIQRAWGGWR